MNSQGESLVEDLCWRPVLEVYFPATSDVIPVLLQITLHFGSYCGNSALAQVEGPQLLVSLVPLSSFQGALIVQGKSWLMETLTDWGTQGRGLLEEEDPEEDITNY